jgi:hypothetical protein
MDDHGVLSWPTFDREKTSHGSCVQGVHRQTVNGLSGERDSMALSQESRRLFNRSFKEFGRVNGKNGCPIRIGHRERGWDEPTANATA